MTTSKRKIKAKPFVRDLRGGTGDEKLMEKYSLSENQLHRVLQKLVDAGAIDEMELFMRTSLSDSAVTSAFLEVQRSVQELDNSETVAAPHELNAPSDITVTERVKTVSKVLGSAISRLALSGS
jgi:hypothetical protein